MSNESDNLDGEEKALFRAAMTGVSPLQHKGDTIHHTKEKPHARRLPPMHAPEYSHDGFSDAVPPTEAILADEWLFARPGLQHRVLRKLRRGLFPIDAELDMHGMRVAEARLILSQFLQQALAANCRVVSIIHGKGKSSQNRQPVLKGRVRHWLQQHTEILAICTTRPEHGGSGAIYVLLRRQHREME